MPIGMPDGRGRHGTAQRISYRNGGLVLVGMLIIRGRDAYTDALREPFRKG